MTFCASWREERVDALVSERTQVGVLGLTTSISSRTVTSSRNKTGFRPVINLNSYIEKRTVKMATFKTFLRASGEDTGWLQSTSRSLTVTCLLRRVTVGSSGSGGKAKVFSSVASHSASVLILGPSRQSPFQLWLRAGRRGFD